MDNRRSSTYRRSRTSHEKEKTPIQKILTYTYRQSILSMIILVLFLGIKLIPLESTQRMSGLIESSISESMTWKTAYQMAYDTVVSMPYMKRWFNNDTSTESDDQRNNESENIPNNQNTDMNQDSTELIDSTLPLDEFTPTEESDFLDQTSVGK